jgi:lipopolysaccharide export system protein LptA
LIGVCAPCWAQQGVPAAEVISVEEVVSTEAGDGSAPIPIKPLRLNTGLVTIESDQQQADQQTGVITASGNVRIVYPDERVVATARQAQYFSNEGRVVLSGDVDILQDGGNWLRAEQVIYLVDSERMQAIPARGQQVFSRVVLSSGPAQP